MNTGADTAMDGTLAPRWPTVYAAGAPLQGWAPALQPGTPAPRAGADAQAAWQRWHDPAADTLFAPAEAPWYGAAERARVEHLAARELPGLALNLSGPSAGRNPRASCAGSTAWRVSPLAASVPSRPATKTCSPRAAHGRGPCRRRAGVRAPAAAGARPRARPQPQRPAAWNTCSVPRLRPQRGAAADAEAGPLDEALAAPPQDWRAFDPRWDEVLPASRLRRPADALALQALQGAERGPLQRLALQLRHRLAARRPSRWVFDLDEGRLDPRRLSRLCVPGAAPAVFRDLAPAPVPEACVTLLVDLSGSMRGAHALAAARAIDLALPALEAAGVRCELLGYTTREGADNPVQRAWQQAGRPAGPMRLNALRHIVFKTAAQPWRAVRPGLALLLAPDFGRENLDGDALHWAAARLARRPERRRVLLVLSDGQPHDEATAAAFGRAVLEDHLRQVIERVEAAGTRLVALGCGPGPARFYRHAVTLKGPEDVAARLFATLADLLAPEGGR
ncbi:MAG: hypothetical protein U1F50_01810 [Rubrivivax sp.]